MSKKGILIKEVYEASIAHRVGILSGDILLCINGEEVNDTIEYRYLICDNKLKLRLLREDGTEYELSLIKSTYEDIGIDFDDPLLENSMRCSNKCIFCFIDQLPKGMRKTLYFKDDDSRLSFLQGNFITLTNLKDEDFERIIKYKISPINVSVHTTNSELRIKMLNNNRAGEIITRLKQLTDGGIRINCQVVLCPDINDGEELVKTINDLAKLYPKISNVAIVPVGVTKFRTGLYNMESFDKGSAQRVIDTVSILQRRFLEQNMEAFARLSDEFYITAGENLPDYEHYGDFEQLEDGIGMTTFFDAMISEELEYTNFDGNGEEIAIITGEMCSDYLLKTMNKIEQKLNITINLIVIKNEFFGGKVSVAGLITGQDIIAQAIGKIKQRAVFIPRNMLKADEEIFLDDITVEEIAHKLNTKLIICKYTGEDLIQKITEEVILWGNQ